jgi:hypothetical protein
LTRGPHQSASKHIPFLRQEFVDMIHKGQWTVLLARLVLHEPQLRLSPLCVVPQRDRRPRTISDSTFFGLNHETVPVSPSECMQFGRALWRILRHVKSANPHHGPIYLSKIDIADGFYCIWVRASDVPKLGILFPAASGEEYLVGFPLSLPMGWTESPKIFTAATKTVADMTNASLKSGDRFPAHHLDTISETPPPPATLPSKSTPSLETPSLPPRSRRSDAPHYGPPLAHPWPSGTCTSMISWASSRGASYAPPCQASPLTLVRPGHAAARFRRLSFSPRASICQKDGEGQCHVDYAQAHPGMDSQHPRQDDIPPASSSRSGPRHPKVYWSQPTSRCSQQVAASPW